MMHSTARAAGVGSAVAAALLARLVAGRDVAGLTQKERRNMKRQGFSAVVLEEDLVLKPDNGKAVICQDDLGNTYDRVGGPFSNYEP